MTQIAQTPPLPLTPQLPSPAPAATDQGSWARRVEVLRAGPTHQQQNLHALQSAQRELHFRTLEQRTIRRTCVPAFVAGMALGGLATIGSVAGGIATDNLALAFGGGAAGMLTLVSSGIGLGCSALSRWHHARRAAQAQERLDREAGLLVLRHQLERAIVVTGEDYESEAIPAPGHHSIGNATPSGEAPVPLAIGALEASRTPSGIVSVTPPTPEGV